MWSLRRNLVRHLTTVNLALLLSFSGANLCGQQQSSAAPAHGSRLASIMDAVGNLYVIEQGSQTIRVIASGNGRIAALPLISHPIAGRPYPLAQVSLLDPSTLTVDAAGDVFVSNQNGATQVIYAGGQVPNLPTAARLGGVYALANNQASEVRGSADDVASPLLLPRKNGIQSDDAQLGASGTPGTIQTVAGVLGSSGSAGTSSGLATTIQINYPIGIAVDTNGNLYYADNGNNAVRLVYAGGTTPGILAAEGITAPTIGWSYLIAGGHQACSHIITPCGDGLLATQAEIGNPWGVALDSSGNVYVADSGGNAVRKIDATSAIITSVAGTAGTAAGYSGDGSLATAAAFTGPWGIALDGSGNLFIADSGNNLIRVVYVGGTVPTLPATISPVAGNIYTVAGTISATFYNGDNQPATSAGLSVPSAVAVDANGNLYIADTYDNLIRRVDAQTQQITTVAGDASGAAAGTNFCSTAPCGDGGPAIAATLDTPEDVKVDSVGNIYIADIYDNTIRKVDGTSGQISAVAGQELATPDLTGDGGPAINAHLNTPNGVALDGDGNLYLSDSYNSAVRVVYGTPILKTQTITFAQLPNVSYGVSPITLTASSDSTLDVSYSVTGPASVSGSTLTITGVGSVSVTASQPGNTMYAPATPVTQTFTVTPATLTVTPNNASIPFGTTLTSSVLTYMSSGLVGSDTLTGTPAYTITSCSDGKSTYTATTVIGTTCTISISGQGSLAISPSTKQSSYTFQYGTGTLTVTGGGTQTITFPTLTGPFTYGQNSVALSGTASSQLPLTYTVTGPATVTGSFSTGYSLTFTGAGTVTITASQAGNNQFAAATPVNQVLTVNRATVTVMAANVSIPYGTTTTSLASLLTYKVTGFVGADSYTGAPTIAASGYTVTSASGATYTITPTPGTLAISPTANASNYNIVYVSGELTVTQDSQTINFPKIPNLSYGSSVPEQASSTSGLPITYVITGPVNANGKITGVGTVTVTASQAGSGNIAPAAPVTQTFAAVPAVLQVIATPASRPQGAPNPVFQYTITGFVNADTNNPLVLTGVPLLTTTATPASPPGTYPIMVTQGLPNVNPALGPLTSTNYTFQFVNGSLSVTSPPTFTMTASTPTLNIQQGQSASSALVFNVNNGYTGSVALSCGNLPIGMNCVFDPATVQLNGTSAYGSVTINTNVNTPAVGALRSSGSTREYLAGMFFFPGVALAGLLFWSRRRFGGTLGYVPLAILALFVGFGVSGCGTSNNNNLATVGTQQIMVTATTTGAPNSGSQNVTTFIYLTVNVTQ